MSGENETDLRLLLRYTGGNYSSAEYKRIVEWFSDPVQRKQLKEAMEMHWKQFTEHVSSESDLSHLYQQIGKQIGLNMGRHKERNE